MSGGKKNFQDRDGIPRRTFLQGAVAAILGGSSFLAGCATDKSAPDSSAKTYDAAKDPENLWNVLFTPYKREADGAQLTTPSYTTRDSDGKDRDVSDSAILKQKISDEKIQNVIAVYGFFTCPTFCDTIANNIAKLMEEIKKKGQSSHVVFIDVDPADDHPLSGDRSDKMKQFYAKLEAQGLSNPEKNVTVLFPKDPYAPGYIAENMGDTMPDKENPLDHTQVVHVYKASGQQVFTLQGAETPNAFMDDVKDNLPTISKAGIGLGG